MAAAPAAPRIFVSYARSDGKDFARDLRRRLQDEHGFPLWQDLADMEGGRDWWQQTTAAIDQTEYLVLVMTAAALASPIVRKEWRYARQQGKCVIPVIGARGIVFDALPGWMRRAHFVDRDDPDQWRRLIRTLEGPCRATRVPLMLEDLPPDYVVRAAVLPERGQALSAGADDTVRLWDLDSGQEMRRYDGQRGIVWLAALRERGQALSIGADLTVRLWDLESGQEMRRFEGPDHGLAVTALPERGQALSAGSDVTVQLWDLESGEQLAVFIADAQFRCCAFTPDGKFALAGDRHGQIHVLEILL